MDVEPVSNSMQKVGKLNWRQNSQEGDSMQKELESGNLYVVLVTQMLEKFGILSQPGGGGSRPDPIFFPKRKI